MPPRRPTVRVAVPTPPRTMAFPRSFLVLTETRVFPAEQFSRRRLSVGQPFSGTGENPPYGTMGRSGKRRHHAKRGPRLEPTRPPDIRPCLDAGIKPLAP